MSAQKKSSIKWPVSAVCAALLALPLTADIARAQDTTTKPSTTAPVTASPAPAARVGNRYQGSVTTVDAAGQSLTVKTKYGETDMTIKTDAITKVYKIANVGVAGLQVGDHIRVAGVPSTDGTSVTARLITVTPQAGKMRRRAAANPAAAAKRGIAGDVATVTPSLTITTPDGKTITVTTMPRTPVLAGTPASFSDIVTGTNVIATGKSDSGVFTARQIMVYPAGLGMGRGGKGGGARRLRKNANPDTASPDTTAPDMDAPSTADTAKPSTPAPADGSKTDSDSDDDLGLDL